MSQDNVLEDLNGANIRFEELRINPGFEGPGNTPCNNGSPVSHVTSCLWDPFYPYMHCLPSQSTTTTSGECSTRPAEILVWRALVHSETGVEHRLQKYFQPEMVEKLLDLNRICIRFQKEGDCVEAEKYFRFQRQNLMVYRELLGKQDYDFLLAWADLPLAHLFQSQGGADMLKDAMNMRKEVLECVMPFQDSHESLVRVCKTYYYTAQYEWGATVMSPQTKNQAIQNYAELMACNEGEAEAQLCFLLCVDHEYSGRFEQSLGWMQEANRLRKSNNSPDAGKLYFLHYEAKLLMKLENYGEAVKVLDDSTHAAEYVDDQEHPKLALKVHGMLEKCYAEMSKPATANLDSQQAVDYEELAKQQRGIQHSLAGAGGGSYPTKRTPSPLGSSLGLVQAIIYLHELDHFGQTMEKLPEPITSVLGSLAKDAAKSVDWKGEIINNEQGRELLKLTKGLVDKNTFDWLLSWYDLILAYLYQYVARKLVNARMIWEEMLGCAKHQMGSDNAFLTQGYEMMLGASLLEGEAETNANWEEQESTVGRLVSRPLLFWLYFGHHRHGNWEFALKWLREAKRLKEELCTKGDHDCAMLKCSEEDYFWSDYNYLLGEADLLVRLGRFEDARVTLEKLLSTRHVQEGSPILAREVKKLLKCCRGSLVDDEEFAVDNCEHKIAEPLPAPTGVTFENKDPNIVMNLALQSKLIQSQAGLEHHLQKLPVPFRLAFRKHGNRGCSLQYSQLDKAIFDFEWCREILTLVLAFHSENSEIMEACDWLTVWASLPLANMYQFKKMKFKKALDLWNEMDARIPDWDPDELSLNVKDALRTAIFTGSYQYFVSELKDLDLKNMVVRDLCERSEQMENNRVSENFILRQLSYACCDHGNFEEALHFIQEAKQYLSSSDDDGMEMDLMQEALCYSKLGMRHEAGNILSIYYNTGKKVEELHPLMQKMLEVFSKSNLTLSDTEMPHEFTNISQRGPPRVQKLRSDISKLLEEKSLTWEECDKAVQQFEEALLELMNKTDNKGEVEMDVECISFRDCLFLAELRTNLCLEKIKSFKQLNREQIEAFCEDINFKRTVAYCDKCIELSPISEKPIVSAGSKSSVAQLYGALDSQYFQHLMSLSIQLRDQRSLSMLSNIHDELQSYLDWKLTRPVQKYGEEAVIGYASLFYNVENTRYNEYQWLALLNRHKELYSVLQSYHCRRADIYAILDVIHKDPGGSEKEIDTCRWNAFMYAEGERTRSMLYQLLGSNKLKSSHEWGFDASDDRALEAIQKSSATLLQGDSIFVQYSCLPEPENAYMAYVIDQDGKLSATRCKVDHEDFKKRLNALYKHLEPKPRKTKRDPAGNSTSPPSYDKDLEFLYDVLIRPIEAQLSKVAPDHKLIIAPTELLTKVPFAALRDKDMGKYLIERHTISVTPSLRVLQVCTERLQHLQTAAPYTGQLGSIVALGDPAYQTMGPKRRRPLGGTGDEVRHIADLFNGTTPVVKVLLKGNATKNQLLHWAAQPSQQESRFRQPVVHVGAHGVIDEENHHNNVLQMACDGPAASFGTDNARPSSDGASTSGGRGELDDYYDSESDSDDETVATSVSSDRFMQSMFNLSGLGVPGPDSPAGNRGSVALKHNSYDLWARDISNLEWKWRAELLVLSACQTSRGRVTTEGVLSMARTFMTAGVPCIVASLWKVDDKATVELMKVFYTKLREGNDVASALRSAMLARMHTHPEAVREWAPFNVWGVPSLRIPKELQG